MCVCVCACVHTCMCMCDVITPTHIEISREFGGKLVSVLMYPRVHVDVGCVPQLVHLCLETSIHLTVWRVTQQQSH